MRSASREYTKALGALVRATSEAAGLTQKDVARRAGLSPRVLRTRLNGTRDLTVGELQRLSAALDTDAALWLGRLEHMFDPHLPVNSEMPPKVPLKPQGSRPVIARMLWLDREEFTPGRAIRWTSTHVMVSWLADPGDPRTELSCWFRADDVSTHLPKRPRGPLG